MVFSKTLQALRVMVRSRVTVWCSAIGGFSSRYGSRLVYLIFRFAGISRSQTWASGMTNGSRITAVNTLNSVWAFAMWRGTFCGIAENASPGVIASTMWKKTGTSVAPHGT